MLNVIRERSQTELPPCSMVCYNGGSYVNPARTDEGKFDKTPFRKRIVLVIMLG